MITLYQFPRCWGLPSMGPYCLKVEAYFRMVGLDYRAETGDMRTAPRGQLPYADIDGRILGDSGAILEEFEQRFHVDRGLSEQEWACGLAVVRTLEESTVWALRYSRFVDERGWPDTRELVRSISPAPLRLVLPTVIRRGMRQALHAQGMGRHAPDRIYQLGCADLDLVAGVLGDKPFLLGDTPRTADMTVFGFLANFLCEHARSPMTDHALAVPTLVAYVERLRTRLFPEYTSWIGVRHEAASVAAARAA